MDWGTEAEIGEYGGWKTASTVVSELVLLNIKFCKYGYSKVEAP